MIIMCSDLIKYISEFYSTDAEYPFSTYPGHAVFRHRTNRKWFAVIMPITRDKLGLEGTDAIYVLNVKCDPILVGNLRKENGFFPAYHMNKTHWITISLDGTVDDEKIRFLLDLSYDLTK